MATTGIGEHGFSLGAVAVHEPTDRLIRIASASIDGCDRHLRAAGCRKNHHRDPHP